MRLTVDRISLFKMASQGTMKALYYSEVRLPSSTRSASADFLSLPFN